MFLSSFSLFNKSFVCRLRFIFVLSLLNSTLLQFKLKYCKNVIQFVCQCYVLYSVDINQTSCDEDQSPRGPFKNQLTHLKHRLALDKAYVPVDVTGLTSCVIHRKYVLIVLADFSNGPPKHDVMQINLSRC